MLAGKLTQTTHSMMRTTFIWWCLWSTLPLLAQRKATFAPDTLPLRDLSAFVQPPPNWHTVGQATADPYESATLQIRRGQGVLVHLPDKKQSGSLHTHLQHGDMALTLEFMMAPGASSGIYLQGRYEIQLHDSWGVRHSTFADCGGIYARSNGAQLFEGHPPAINACAAPGVWQQLHIAFQAPRFDAQGRKVANARILRVVLNGYTVQQDIELSGPTHDAPFKGEAAQGPLVFQSDHGAIAFRRIRYRTYSGPVPQWQQLHYEVFYGPYDWVPRFDTLRAAFAGTIDALNWQVARRENEFAIRFKGLLDIPTTGLWRFELTTNGNGYLLLDGQQLFDQRWWSRDTLIQLEAGTHEVVVTYSKNEGWLQGRLGLFVESAHVAPTPLHQPVSFLLERPIPPILVPAEAPVRPLRHFLDLPLSSTQRKRLVHAISMGFPCGLHYSFDLDRAALPLLWRGHFIDATPMWFDRGDGSARPNGAVLWLDALPAWVRLSANDSAALQRDSFPQEANYRSAGYSFDPQGIPTFHYQMYGLHIAHRIWPDTRGQALQQTLEVAGTLPDDLWLRVACAKKVEPLNGQLWSIDDGHWLLFLPKGTTTRQLQVAGYVHLLVRPTSALSWKIIW